MLDAPRGLALLLSCFAAGCAEASFPSDLATLCRVVAEVDAIPELTASEKLARIDARHTEYAHRSLLDTRDIWAEAGAHVGEDRYRYLVAAAKKMKAPDWRCPSYGAILNAAAIEKLARAATPPAPVVVTPPPAATLAQAKAPAAPSEPAAKKKAKLKSKRHKRARS